MSISIVIPVLNEQQAVGVCLDRLLGRNGRNGCGEHGDGGEHSDGGEHDGCSEHGDGGEHGGGLEIVVVDGGSTDQTLREVAVRGLTPIASSPGRGTQQHVGAQASTGDILLFLHCDTALPRNFIDHVQRILQLNNVVAGAFRLAINVQDCQLGLGFRLIEIGANARSMLLGLPYGDQALFMRRETYFAAGGFPEQPIMEDVALVSRLKKLGKIMIAPACVNTSARRWQRHGLVKTTVINQLMLLGRAGGVSSQRLAQWYYNKRYYKKRYYNKRK